MIDTIPVKGGRKRPITVTVSGPRGSGRTTFIAIVAQALRESGHHVTVPNYVPVAEKAINGMVDGIMEQFDITFVEADGGE